MTEISGQTLAVAAAVLLLVLFLVGSCTLSCGKSTEGYQRSELGQHDFSLVSKSGIDSIMDHTTNPHWMANPGSKYQPLTNGPVDLFADDRYFGRQPAFSFQGGSLYPRVNITNDEKGRADTLNNGAWSVYDSLMDASPVGGMERRFDNVANTVNWRPSQWGGAAGHLQYARPA